MSKNTEPDGDGEVIEGYVLCIMRHGIAVTRGTAGFPDDFKRPLTPEGKEKMRDIAAGLDRMGFEADWVVTSPLVRAVETAKIVAESLGTRAPVDLCDALRQGGSTHALIAFLAAQPSRKRVLVVGHEPGLSELAGQLIGAGPNAGLVLKKGGCCLISFDQSPQVASGRLVWWLTPRLLRKLR